jgi:hypothetical protein
MGENLPDIATLSITSCKVVSLTASDIGSNPGGGFSDDIRIRCRTFVAL